MKKLRNSTQNVQDQTEDE